MALRVVTGIAAEAGKGFVSQAKDVASSVMERVGKKEDGEKAEEGEEATKFAQRSLSGSWDARQEQLFEEQPKIEDPRDRVMTLEEFNRTAARLRRDYKAPQSEQRGSKSDDDVSWTAPRRFKARIRNVQVQSMTSKACTIFLEFMVGGTLLECRVKEPRSNKVKPMVEGYSGHRFTTHHAEAQPGRIPVSFSVEECFEWRGSYAQLERERSEIIVWRLRQHSLNEVLARSEDLLRTLAGSSVSQTVLLDGMVDGKKQPMFRISFEIQFEEVYDFELSLVDFKFISLPDVLSKDRSKSEPELREPELRALLVKEDVKFSQKLTAGQKKVQFRIPLGGENYWPMRALSPLSKERSDSDENENLPFWDFLGVLKFRGSLSDLEASQIDFRVKEGNKSSTILCEGTARLREIFDFPYLTCDLTLPTNPNSRVGQLQGVVAIPNRPKYRQIGRVMDIDPSKLYLFLRLIKVDELHTNDERPNIDSYVEAHYGSQVKQTSVVIDSCQPYYQTDLLFQIEVSSPQSPSRQELTAFGPLRLDVWAESAMANEHIGWTQIELGEILFHATGQERQKETKTFYDRLKSKEMPYSTRVFQGSRRLINIWDNSNDRISNIFFEVWTKPDLGSVSLPVPRQPLGMQLEELPDELLSKLSPAIAMWNKKLESSVQQSQLFPISMCNQWRKKYLLCSFLTPASFSESLPSSAEEVTVPLTPGAIHNFIRCIPFVDTQMGAFWMSPQFLLHQRQGSLVDHVLLHACLLLGLKIPAFVCLGTLWNHEPYAWVATFSFANPADEDFQKYPYRLLFWDTMRNVAYHIPNSLADPLALWNYTKELKGQKGLPSAEVCSALETALASLAANATANNTASSAPGDSQAPHMRLISSLLPSRNPNTQQQQTSPSDSAPQQPAQVAPRRPPFAPYRSSMKIKCPKRLPYRSINIMFNHEEILANLQYGHPNAILYDFWDRNLWHPFLRGTVPNPTSGVKEPGSSLGSGIVGTAVSSSSSAMSASTHSLIPEALLHLSRRAEIRIPSELSKNILSGASDTIWASQAQQLLYEELKKYINKRRYGVSKTAVTRWVRDPQSITFLEEGAKRILAWDTSEPYSAERKKAEANFEDWRMVLFSNTPQNHRLRWGHLQVPHSSPNFVASQAWNRIPFLRDMDKSGQLALGIHVVSLPNKVACTCVVLCLVTRMKAFELRKAGGGV